MLLNWARCLDVSEWALCVGFKEDIHTMPQKVGRSL
jgi:hypothetical protein